MHPLQFKLAMSVFTAQYSHSRKGMLVLACSLPKKKN